jgi:hypothetical protein
MIALAFLGGIVFGSALTLVIVHFADKLMDQMIDDLNKSH